MEDEFAVLYQKLISRIDPDPDRLRRGMQALSRAIAGHDPPEHLTNQLQSQKKRGGRPHAKGKGTDSSLRREASPFGRSE